MAKRAGVVLERDDVTILDTNAMPWEDHFYGGTKTKILTRFDDGAPMVQIEWIPAGLETFGDALERHAHAVTERLLVFAGEFPIIEYEDFDDTVGERVVFKPGWYLDRRAGSVHGADPANPAPVGFLCIEWREGRSYVGEDGSETEVHHLDGPVSPKPQANDPAKTGGGVYERDNVTILDTTAMAWEDHHYPGFKAKILSRDANGAPSVQLVWMPPALTSFDEKAARHAHTNADEWVLLLAGEISMREYESFDDTVGETVVLKPGYYVDRRRGSVHGADPADPSPVGALWLAWRTGPHYLGEPGAENDIDYLE